MTRICREKFSAPRGGWGGVARSLGVVGVSLLWTRVAHAHEVPDGSAWVMADWMLLSFATFFGVALFAFVVALRRGLLSHLEEAKFYLLTVDEPDYYTPEWAKDEK